MAANAKKMAILDANERIYKIIKDIVGQGTISFQKHSIYSKYSFNEYEMYIHVMRGCWLWQDLILLDHVNYEVK